MDSSELDDILSGVRRFVRDVVVPLEAQIDDSDEFPPEVIEQAKAMGLYGFALPEEYGGLGLSALEEMRLVLGLGWETPAFRSLLGANHGGGVDAPVVPVAVRDQQRHRGPHPARRGHAGAEEALPAEAGER